MFLSLMLSIGLAAADPPAVPPASDAAVDAFIAALPPAQTAADPGEPFDQDRLERLVGLNPGREAEVREIHAANEACEEASKKHAVKAALRSSARRLGDEKLAALTAFYKGPDYKLYARLARQPETELSDAEKAELARILAAYPLEDFLASTRQTEQEMWSADGLLGALMRCGEEFDAELEGRGFKR